MIRLLRYCDRHDASSDTVGIKLSMSYRCSEEYTRLNQDPPAAMSGASKKRGRVSETVCGTAYRIPYSLIDGALEARLMRPAHSRYTPIEKDQLDVTSSVVLPWLSTPATTLLGGETASAVANAVYARHGKDGRTSFVYLLLFRFCMDWTANLRTEDLRS